MLLKRGFTYITTVFFRKAYNLVLEQLILLIVKIALVLTCMLLSSRIK